MTVPLNSLFKVTYGSKFDLNKMTELPATEGGINFVGRSSRNHGVTARVAPVDGRAAYPAGNITVALGGTKLLASFVQLQAFYTAQNVAVLQPLIPLTFGEKLYICLCIRHNRFRYSAFGREANRTLRSLPVPSRSEFPAWVYETEVDAAIGRAEGIERPVVSAFDVAAWRPFLLSDLFDIRKGIRLTRASIKPGSTAFISAIDSNNGLRQRIDHEPLHPAGVVTVNYNGNGVAESFYQPEPFVASDDVNVLYPRIKVNIESLLFLCTVIRREKYRFSYGRKWTLERMNQTVIRLPVSKDGLPDWRTMSKVILSVTPSHIKALETL